MSPAKLLGLWETEDSIIVRPGTSAKARALPRAYVHVGTDARDDDAGDDSGKASRVLRSLIALRKLGDRK